VGRFLLGCVGLLLAGVAGWHVQEAVSGQDPSLQVSSDGELVRTTQALMQERQKSQYLERQLVAALREATSQAMALADSAAQKQELDELRHSLEEERARVMVLSLELDMARNAAKSVGFSASSGLTGLQQPQAGLVIEIVPEPPPETPAEAEARRFMGRARQLLDQHNIFGARSMLERVAESGNAQALFSLAETYDPSVLSRWGTVGTQGDAAKAEELYAKAFAGGLQDAAARLRTLRPETTMKVNRP
jgi:hypothetical protein